MAKLIVCLGYSLKQDNSIHPILENRLKDAIDLCRQNGNSTLLLMGSSRYGDSREGKISEASAMREYIEKYFAQDLIDVKILTEEETKSTVEQLCYLKNFIKSEKLNSSNVAIVSSEFFNERVKLYTEYIFGNIDGIVFVGSRIPKDMEEKFKEAEAHKLQEGEKWLMNIEKGDDERISREQKAFQTGVLKGEIKQPPIS